MGCDPADTEPGQTERFGHDAQRNAPVIQLANCGQAIFRFIFKQTINLIRKNDKSVGLRKIDQLAEFLMRHEVSGGIMRKIYDHQFCVGAQASLEVIKIQGPTVSFAGFPEGHLTSDRFGHFHQGLITGIMDDHMIILRQMGVH